MAWEMRAQSEGMNFSRVFLFRSNYRSWSPSQWKVSMRTHIHLPSMRVLTFVSFPPFCKTKKQSTDGIVSTRCDVVVSILPQYRPETVHVHRKAGEEISQRQIVIRFLNIARVISVGMWWTELISLVDIQRRSWFLPVKNRQCAPVALEIQNCHQLCGIFPFFFFQALARIESGNEQLQRITSYWNHRMKNKK